MGAFCRQLDAPAPKESRRMKHAIRNSEPQTPPVSALAVYNPDEGRLRSKVSLESRAILQRALQLAEGDELDDQAAAEAERVLAEFRASWATNMQASGLGSRLDSLVDEVIRLDARDLVEPARRGPARRAIGRTLVRIDGLAAVPNPACCSSPGVLCVKCRALPEPEALRTDAADHDSPEYRAGAADFERRHGRSPTQKDPMSKQPKTTLDHARSAGWLGHFGPGAERLDALDDTDARARSNIRSHMAAFMPLDHEGKPRMPQTPAEQARFDAGAARLRQAADQRDIHERHRATVARTDAEKGPDELRREFEGDDEEAKAERARRRANQRAANRWREPLDKEGQARLDEARLLRDEEEAGGPDAA
jgi:hypothetical protein